MGLSAIEVHELTVAELFEAVDGARARHEQQRERDAWIVHHLVAPYCEKGRVPSIDALLGREGAGDRLRSWDAVDAVLGGEEAAAEQRRAAIEEMRAARAAGRTVSG